jgi:Mg2+-importing ATPase
LPVTPLAPLFGFGVLPPIFWPALGGILVAYLAAAELTKKVFYRRARSLNGPKRLPPATDPSV